MLSKPRGDCPRTRWFSLKRCLVFIVLVAPLCSIDVRAQPVEHFFESNGVRIRYVISSQGDPVILIHPFATNLEIWQPVVVEFSQKYQVIALDCRGHGQSDKPHDPKQYGLEMVRDVGRLMDHLGIKRSI